MNKKDKWRFLALGIVFAACFALIIVRLANLQVRSGDDYGSEDYSAKAASTMTKTISQAGARGQILDVNGALLAYDKKIYTVEFYRQPSSDQAKNAEYSKAIWEVIKLLEREGKEVKFSFWLARDEQGEWAFDFKTNDAGVAENREKMFRSNFYVKNIALEDIYDKLCTNYQIHKIDALFPENEKLTEEDKLQVLSVWQEMQMNAFNSVPITLASDVKWSTAMEIETRMISLPGISINVKNQRVYPKGPLACHILGYTGLMQQERTPIEEYLAKGYQRNDTIGLDGVEKTMEDWLTGNSSLRRGYTLAEVDRSGRRIRTLSSSDASDGNTVKLTIDSSLQQVVEEELANVISLIRDEEEKKMRDPDWLELNKEELLKYQDNNNQQIKLAQNGAIVVLDMNARVKAMASFPNYDPNLFIVGMNEEQRERMLLDKRNPLFNNAIQARDTPGSVFKMCTALAALTNGQLTINETISDDGLFKNYDTTNPPKCWIALRLTYRHANQDIALGLEHSCNYFFYTIASRLFDNFPGEDKLYEYATKLGLTSKTNIDLPGEAKSVVGSQASLYDPSRPINGYDQDTWMPVQIKAKLKSHLKAIGEKYNIQYSDERLDTCIKALMDMAVVTEQGLKQATWTQAIRQILLEELGMSTELIWKQEVVGPIVEQLNQIKWGGSYAIQTAIGQSVTLTTPVAMARYVVAIANGGYVYDVQLIDSIISPSGEVINSFDEPVLVQDLSAEIAPYLDAIKKGMKNVVEEEGGTAKKYFTGFDYIDQIAGKTGTAEKSKIDLESNSWFVMFAPYDEPEIVIVVYVPYGLSGGMSSQAARNIVQYYMDSRVDDVQLVLPAPNSLVQ